MAVVKEIRHLFDIEQQPPPAGRRDLYRDHQRLLTQRPRVDLRFPRFTLT